MITLKDIEEAQQVLTGIVAEARAKSMGYKQSRAWANQLGIVATMRRQYERQCYNAKSDSGWGK